MPVWCPKCHAMLSDGTVKCPRCGAKLPKTPSDPNTLTRQEFKAVLAEAYKFALLPVAMALLAGLLCLAVLYLGK
ncbi:MAG: hypothetical protein Fur0018_15380 [Anaerolineales bacterium]